MNLKSFRLLWVVSFVVCCSLMNATPKYIFYFIGDGMGINATELTRLFLEENKQPNVLADFSYRGYVASNSASNDITDSSAGGTALATGTKVKNGAMCITMSGDSLRPITYDLKQKGYQVGILTSVSIDHATPGSFFARSNSRNGYYEIATQLPTSGFDFFGGSGFLEPQPQEGSLPPLETLFKEGGYTWHKGLAAWKANPTMTKTVITQPDGADWSMLPSAIDRQGGELMLTDLMDCCLTQFADNKRPFFIMCEGGKIDWAGHANDAATMVRETEDFFHAVEQAMAFYKKHPKETLIIVTADHETGGLTMRAKGGPYDFNFGALAAQRVSKTELTTLINQLLKERPSMTWDEMKAFIAPLTGLFATTSVTEKEEAKLREEFEKVFVGKDSKAVESLYSKDNKLAVRFINLVNMKANIGFHSDNHTASPVPLFTIGKGAAEFTSLRDNTQIPRLIMQLR